MAKQQDPSSAWQNPLVTRYASREMSELFGERHRIVTWRRLWVALAEGERALGVPISRRQIAEMKRFVERPNLAVAARYEAELRHDVMAHIRAYGEQARSAAGVIHLGATSCDITDNADLVVLREALHLTAGRIAAAAKALAGFAKRHRKLPCLGATHLQAAQPTTVGKRACLWLYDVVLDYQEIVRLVGWLPFRSVKGTTGTQDSFLELFDGSHAKVRKLERLVARKMGFRRLVPVSGQTYTRKLDAMVVGAVAGIAQSAHKMANDVRLLSNLRELEEPFGTRQIGSSAMPHKRNPMRSERICSLARHVLAVAQALPLTVATQWLERTLDDSAGRRLAIPEAFLGADAVLLIATNVARGLVVHPEVIAARLRQEAPFLATERVLMAAVKAGGDRQALHERLRRHAVAARERMNQGRDNDLADRLRGDTAFAHVADRIDELLDPERLAGRAPQQVAEFLRSVVRPILEREAELLGIDSSLSV